MDAASISELGPVLDSFHANPYIDDFTHALTRRAGLGKLGRGECASTVVS